MIRIIKKEDKKKKNKIKNVAEKVTESKQTVNSVLTKFLETDSPLVSKDTLFEDLLASSPSDNEQMILKSDLIQICQGEIDDVLQQDKMQADNFRKQQPKKWADPPDLAKPKEAEKFPKRLQKIVDGVGFDQIEGDFLMIVPKKQKKKRPNHGPNVSKQNDSQSISTADEPKKEEPVEIVEVPVELDQETIARSQQEWR